MRSITYRVQIAAIALCCGFGGMFYFRTHVRYSQILFRLRQLALLGLLTLLPFTASALSCYGINDKFFLKCSAEACEVSFRAREIHRFGACARRFVVESVPADTQSVILKRIGEVKRPGVYEVTVVHRFYGEPPVNASDLSKAFNAEEFRVPRLTVQDLAPDTNLSELREQWASRSLKESWTLAGYWGIELLLLCVALFVSYRTITAYRKRLRNATHGRLIGPVLLQLCIVVIGVLSLGSPTWPMLVGLIAPLMLIILLYELVSYLIQRFVRRTINEF
jgi:hypothetical protein